MLAQPLGHTNLTRRPLQPGAKRAQLGENRVFSFQPQQNKYPARQKLSGAGKRAIISNTYAIKIQLPI